MVSLVSYRVGGKEGNGDGGGGVIRIAIVPQVTGLGGGGGEKGRVYYEGVWYPACLCRYCSSV